MSRNGKNNKGGRPRGKKTIAVIERDAAIKNFRERVSQHAGTLFEIQFGLAKGAQYLFRIDKEWIKTGEGKNGDRGFWRNKTPVRVENPEEMRQFLEDEFCNGDAEDDQDPGASYYFLVAKDPDNRAIDSMLDRTFGRSKSEIDVNVNVPEPIYGGKSQLPAPKKIKAVVIHEAGEKILEEIEEE